MNYIGIDIGGTKIAVVMGSESCDILQKESFATAEHPSPDDAMDRILRIVKGMLLTAPAAAVGISCGGPLSSRDGVILSPPNLPGWDDVRIVERLSTALNLPVFLQNDANACALAEWRFGAGIGTRHMAFLTFGTGMGVGLILNGALYEGAVDMAGEIGHIRLEQYGPIGYGKAGSFEGFCSGGGIRQQMETVLEEARQTGKPLTFTEPTAKALAQLADEGEPWALSLFCEIGRNLGRGLSILIDLLNPERIVIGSIYARCTRYLEPSMREVIAREALPASRAACRIVPALLGERIGDVAALSTAMNGGS